MIRALAAALLALACASADAATYYVDYDTGVDTNNGTSTSTPWKRMPGVTGWAGSATLGSGDVICLKGGVTFPKRIYLNYFTGSTSGGSYTIQGDCAGWGSGQARVDVPASENVSAAIYVDGVNGIAVRGVFAANRLYAPNNWYAAIYVVGSAAHPVNGFTLRSAEAAYSQEGVWINDSDTTSTLPYTPNVSNILIEDVVAHDNTADASVANANCSGVRLRGAGNVTIRRLETYNNGRTCYASGLNEGRGVTIEGASQNVVLEDSNLHHDSDAAGLEGSGIEGHTSDGVIIRRNRIWGGATAAEIKHNANNWEIHGNVFDGRSLGPFQYGQDVGVDSLNGVIVNNVFITSNTGCQNGVVTISSPVRFQNNLVIAKACTDRSPIILDNRTTAWAFSAMDGIFDHNVTVGGTTALHVMTVTTGPTYANYTIPNYVANISANQLQGSQRVASTKLMGGTVPDTTPASMLGYRPPAGSALRGTGAYVGPFSDYRGCALGNPASVGAFEVCGGDDAGTRTVAGLRNASTQRAASGLRTATP